MNEPPAVLRARRRILLEPPQWALSSSGLNALIGRAAASEPDGQGALSAPVEKVDTFYEGFTLYESEEEGPLAGHLAELEEIREEIVPLQHRAWLGRLLVGAILRGRSRILSHLLCVNTGLREIPRDRRRARDPTTKLVAILDGFAEAAKRGCKSMTDGSSPDVSSIGSWSGGVQTRAYRRLRISLSPGQSCLQA